MLPLDLIIYVCELLISKCETNTIDAINDTFPSIRDYNESKLLVNHSKAYNDYLEKSHGGYLTGDTFVEYLQRRLPANDTEEQDQDQEKQYLKDFRKLANVESLMFEYCIIQGIISGVYIHGDTYHHYQTTKELALFHQFTRYLKDTVTVLKVSTLITAHDLWVLIDCLPNLEYLIIQIDLIEKRVPLSDDFHAAFDDNANLLRQQLHSSNTIKELKLICSDISKIKENIIARHFRDTFFPHMYKLTVECEKNYDHSGSGIRFYSLFSSNSLGNWASITNLCISPIQLNNLKDLPQFCPYLTHAEFRVLPDYSDDYVDVIYCFRAITKSFSRLESLKFSPYQDITVYDPYHMFCNKGYMDEEMYKNPETLDRLCQDNALYKELKYMELNSINWQNTITSLRFPNGIVHSPFVLIPLSKLSDLKDLEFTLYSIGGLHNMLRYMDPYQFSQEERESDPNLRHNITIGSFSRLESLNITFLSAPIPGSDDFQAFAQLFPQIENVDIGPYETSYNFFWTI